LNLQKPSLVGFFLLVGLHASAFPAPAEEFRPPFQPGEQLTYSLRWRFIHAGSAVFEVLPMEELYGVRAYHFVMTVRSSSFLDMFYKVRDRVEGYADVAMAHSLLYKNEQREGGYSRDVIVTFDWESETAQFENRGEKRDPIFVYPGTFDPLSITYFIRMQKLVPGSVLKAPVTDGKRLVIGRLKVIEKQKVKVPAGKYEAFLVEPVVKNLGGVFKRSEASSIQIWLSADPSQIPLKVIGKAKLGSFSAVLVSAESVSR
jgi:hypothetical protein